jgi:hypothetical protein
VARGREVVLVPAELHSSYRHLGGVSTMPVDRRRRGMRLDDDPRPTGVRPLQTVPEDVLLDLEAHLGLALPRRYRDYLARGNGGEPVHVGVLSGAGFVADQPLFGLGRDDRHQDLIGANNWLADRFTDEFLAIGYVQGGMIAVKVRGAGTDSIWYWDDDDFRDDDAFDAAYISAHLLHRCAADIDEFWAALRNPAKLLLTLVAQLVESGEVHQLLPEGAGDALPGA